MAATLVDRVKIQVLSSGTGPFQLGPAVPAYRGVEALVDGSEYSYAVENGSSYEAGTGTYVAGSQQFIRSPQISSNGGATVAFPADVQLVFTALAQDYSTTGAAEAGAAAGAAAGTASGTIAGAAAATAAIAGLGAGGGSGSIGFQAGIAAPATRTVQSKARDTVSIMDQNGMVANGTTDDTTALQALLNDATAPRFDGLGRTVKITGALMLTRTAELSNLKLKPETNGNLVALTIGNTAADATTTLSTNAAETAISVVVTSATGFAVGKLIVFTFNNPTWVAADPLAASYQFVTRIIGVSGTTITLLDNLPHAIQSGWTHTVAAWTPTRYVKGTIELDQSLQGTKRVITAISKAANAVVTSNGHGFTNGTSVTVCGPLSGMVEIHGVTALVQNATTNTFELAGVNSTGFTTYTGGATVRQAQTGINLACVDSPDLEINAYDGDGSGSAVRIGICYQPNITVRTRNCGSDGAADVQSYCWTGGVIRVNSDAPAGFGATMLGGHNGVCEMYSSLRAETGRGFKTGKTKNVTYYGGAIDNPAFTGLSITWVTQSCLFIGFQVRGSIRSAIQPTGIWTSACYNINNKLIGAFSRGSTLDVQVNNTDNLEMIGCEIGTLDMPSGANATMIGGSVDTVSGTASGSLKYLRADGIALSGNQAVKLTDAASGFPLVLFGSSVNSSAWGTDGSGNGQVFTDRVVAQFLRGAPTSGQTNISLVYHNGSTITFQRVTLGAADSGGSGFKLLRVPN